MSFVERVGIFFLFEEHGGLLGVYLLQMRNLKIDSLMLLNLMKYYLEQEKLSGVLMLEFM
jgi:hypothetical protein